MFCFRFPLHQLPILLPPGYISLFLQERELQLLHQLPILGARWLLENDRKVIKSDGRPKDRKPLCHKSFRPFRVSEPKPSEK